MIQSIYITSQNLRDGQSTAQLIDHACKNRQTGLRSARWPPNLAVF